MMALAWDSLTLSVTTWPYVQPSVVLPRAGDSRVRRKWPSRGLQAKAEAGARVVTPPGAHSLVLVPTPSQHILLPSSLLVPTTAYSVPPPDPNSCLY